MSNLSYVPFIVSGVMFLGFYISFVRKPLFKNIYINHIFSMIVSVGLILEFIIGIMILYFIFHGITAEQWLGIIPLLLAMAFYFSDEISKNCTLVSYIMGEEKKVNLA